MASDRERIDLRTEPELRQRIMRQAKRYGVNMSSYIRQAITERLERDEANESKGKGRKAPSE